MNCFTVAVVLLMSLLVSSANAKGKKKLDRNFRRDEANKETIRRLWDSLIGDTPLQIVITGEVPDVFAQDVRGRVSPVGVYEDLAGTIEYVYGLGGAAVIPMMNEVSEVNFIYLLADENTVSARVDLTYSDSTFPEAPPRDYNLTMLGFFRFNDEGTVQSYDISALNLGRTLDHPEPLREQFIQTQCGAIQIFCTGSNQVYNSTEECIGFMSSIPFGTYDQARSNSVVCRSIHLGLAYFRPDVHCPHVSPGGGEKCIELPADNALYYEYEF